MSLLVYNGVTLPLSLVTTFNQEPVYDDSKTDWCLTKFDVGVQAVINADYISVIDPTIGTVLNAAHAMNAIRTKLLQPRKTLSFSFNGVDIIPQKAGVLGTVDAKNGPKPQMCSVTQLTNTTFLIGYHITAHYWENPPPQADNAVKPNPIANRPGNNVLFNRWSETQTIDSCGFSTRTRTGKYAIRSDNVDGATADGIRSQMAVVGVPPGFIRESSNYTVTPDGLAIEYTIVDKEQFKMPPSPAFRAEGHYTETTMTNGAVRWGEVNIKLFGNKPTLLGGRDPGVKGPVNTQTFLIEAALSIASAKIRLNSPIRPQGFNGPLPGFALLQQCVITVDMYSNIVHIKMRVRMLPTTSAKSMKNKTRGVAGFELFQDMAITPGSDLVEYTPAYQDRGSARFLLHSAAYFDPSLKATLNKVSEQMTLGKEPGTAGKNPE